MTTYLTDALIAAKASLVAAALCLMLTNHTETAHLSISAPTFASGASTASASTVADHRAAGRGHDPRFVLRTPAGAAAPRSARPSNRPHGAASRDYALQRTPTGASLHWGCVASIPVWVDATGAPAGFSVLVRQTIRQVASATGYTFVFQAAPRPVGDPLRSGGLWIHFGRVTERSDTPSGWPATAVTPTMADNDGTIVGAEEVFSSTRAARSGRLPSLLLHETAHAMGLAHNYADPASVMNPAPTARRFDAGDLAGLRAVGHIATCARSTIAPLDSSTDNTPTDQSGITDETGGDPS